MSLWGFGWATECPISLEPLVKKPWSYDTTSGACRVAGMELRPHCVGFLSLGSLDRVGVCGEDSERWPFNACTLLAPSAFVFQSDTSNTFCEYKLLPFFLMVSGLRDILYYRLGFIGGIFVGAFTELRKAAISFVISLCPFVCLTVRKQQLGFHWTRFHEILYLVIFRQWPTEKGVWGFKPSPKFRSFDKAEPNSLFHGKYIRNCFVFLFHNPN
jgi:hypothetical protein